MKILIFVNKFDASDDLLGFFVGWVNKLLDKFEKITVITQHEGSYPKNSKLNLVSIDKDKNGRMARLFKYVKLLWKLRRDYDLVFVVMAPSWAIISSVVRIFGKKAYLWYAVWRGNWKLRIAEMLVNNIFSSVREAFPINSQKVVALGQGIDVEQFVPNESMRENNHILFLGRIAPVKRIEVLLKGLGKLRASTFFLDIVGDVSSESDRKYLEDLRRIAYKSGIADRSNWVGRVGHNQTAPYYQRADIFINLTPAGSFDKTMLEAMACGDLVLASNPAMAKFLSPKLRGLLIFREDDPDDLAEKLNRILNMNQQDKNQLRLGLRGVVVRNHSIEKWVENFTRAIIR